MKVLRLLYAISIALSLSACGSNISTQVEAFASNNPPHIGDRIWIFPIVENGQETLENAVWVNTAKEELIKKKFIIANSPETADVFLGVGVTMKGARDVQSTYHIPQFGVTGYSGARTSGTVSSYGGVGTINTTTTLIPQYGVTGYTSGVQTNRVFDRFGMAIFYRPAPANQKPIEVYSVRANSSGSCGMLSAVAPAIIIAMLKEFPKPTTSRIDMPWDGRC
jgi:hypothetical protein